MGVFTIQFDTVIMPKLEAAITDVLKNEVRDAALNAVEDSADSRIYGAYSSSGRRRFSAMDDASYSWEVNGDTLKITYVAGFQGQNASGDLGDVIASGNSNYHMPFPRPWMDEGVQDNIAKIESALKAGLESRGF